jgi:hypothetical protein
MKSHELLRQVFKKVGCKNVAQELKLSLSLIHQWSRPRGGRSDAINPLDRTAELLRLTGDLRPLHWLCEQAGGYFVSNPKTRPHPSHDLVRAENDVMTDFGEMLEVIARAARDKVITNRESAAIRAEWERLKSLAESFVVCCEHGDFESLRTATKDLRTCSPNPMKADAAPAVFPADAEPLGLGATI